MGTDIFTYRVTTGGLTSNITPVSMAAGIAGAKLVVLEEAGHLSNLEQLIAFSEAVRKLVARITRA